MATRTVHAIAAPVTPIVRMAIHDTATNGTTSKRWNLAVMSGRPPAWIIT